MSHPEELEVLGWGLVLVVVWLLLCFGAELGGAEPNKD